MGFDVISYVLAKKTAISGSLDSYVKEQLETLESEIHKKADADMISKTYAKKIELEPKFDETDVATDEEVSQMLTEVFGN